MPRPSFETLSRRLVEAGVAQRFADRIRNELQDHFADLEEELRKARSSPRRAALEARRRLGTNDAIVREFAKRPELLCWVYRSHWLLQVLRAVSLVLLALRATTDAFAAWRAALLRYALAAGLAASLTGTLLFTLQWSILAEEPAAAASMSRAEALDATLHVARLRPNRTYATKLVSARAPTADSDEPAPASAKAQTGLRASLNPAQPPSSIAVDTTIAVPALSAFAVERPEAQLAPLRPRLSDGEFLPIVKVAPIFPAFAAQRGIEGYVIVEYTVTAVGSVRDIVVIESSNGVFERAAVEAAAKFKYKPRVIDGQPVAVRGVRARMTFTLEA